MFPGGKIPGEDWIYSWYTIAVAVGFGMILGLRNYMRGPQVRSRVMLEGKNVIITGASAGIGLELAKELAGRGARVILGCQDDKKAKQAAEEVRAASQTKKVHGVKLDLSSLSSVREFVERYKSKYKVLDVLVNNAGIMYHPQQTTEDNLEIHFAVNYLGHFLLTHLLLDELKASEGGRILNLTCPAYQLAEIHLDDLQFEKREFNSASAFSQSKLCVVLFTTYLAKYLEGTKVTANVVHPGICYTQIYRNMPFMKSKVVSWSFTPMLWFLMKGARDGAQTIVHCAIATEEEGVSGKLYSDCAAKDVDNIAKNPELAEKVWNASLKLAGVKLG